MKFIVEPLNEKEQKGDHTMCALCSEDPRFCNEW